MAHNNEHGVNGRLGDGSLLGEDPDTGLGHIVPVKVYTSVFIGLLFLTIVTLWAATQHFGAFNLVIALIIAAIKAKLVTLFFMHLKWESKAYWFIAIYPIFIFVLLLVGTLVDGMVKYKTHSNKNDIETMTDELHKKYLIDSEKKYKETLIKEGLDSGHSGH